MFYAKTDRMFTENAEGREGTRVPLHNTEDNGERPHAPEDSSSSSGNEGNKDGTWGERDIGGPVNFRNAMLDYEEMRRELTGLSKTRTSKSGKSNKTDRQTGLKKVTTNRSQVNAQSEHGRDVEAQEEGENEDEDDDDDEEDFQLGEFLKDGHFEKRQEGRSAKKVGVVYKNLTVKGLGATATFVKTLPSAVVGVSNPDRCPRFPAETNLSDSDFRPRFV